MTHWHTHLGGIYSAYLPSTYLATLDQQRWIEQPVPLVKDHDTSRITQRTDGYNDLVYTAQTYLESKMHKADRKVRPIQTVQDQADGPAASEE